MPSLEGISPTPRLPDSSSSTSTQRMNQGAWPPLRLSRKPSSPATGTMFILVILGNMGLCLL